MSISIVQRVFNAGSSTNGSATLAAATAGNTLVIAAAILQASASITNPAGFADDKRQQNPAASATAIICRKTAAGGETLLQFTHGNVIWVIEAYELSGVAGLDGTPTGNNSASSADIQPGSIAPTFADDFYVVSTAILTANGGSEAIGDGFTVRDAAGYNRACMGDKLKTGGDIATENPHCTWLTAGSCGVAMAAYSPLQTPNQVERIVPRGVSRGVHRGAA